MIVHEHSAEAAVDPAVVWDRWTQVEHWPVDDPQVERATLNGPIAVGAVGQVKLAGGPRATFRFAQVDRMGGRFAIECKLLLCTLRLEHELDRPDPDAPDVEGQDAPSQLCRITHRVVLTGPLARLWNRVIGAAMGRGLPTVVANVVAVAAI
ncbi:hypothetical protein [Propioniciclava soli]|uniref:SRPBCC family protein n=1 Tax=Propioniciclava soli TaxID=2775081 RepID=A0ABZ3C6W8_9ACTN|nr:hypothetical protein [Propioniciclava soli]